VRHLALGAAWRAVSLVVISSNGRGDNASDEELNTDVAEADRIQ